jgi:large subunit ribosomal protein L22
VRIEGRKLSKVAAEKNLTVEQLAAAVVRTGLPQARALAAVRNWMAGRDHPRCKAEDITRLAAALGVEPARIAKFQCVFRYHRGSPRKAALLADLIRGKDFDTARNLLTFNTRRAAVDVNKALMGAYADAEQANADLGALVVTESRVDEGPMMKRFQPKDRGRAHRILKRMSHITVSVEERSGRAR